MKRTEDVHQGGLEACGAYDGNGNQAVVGEGVVRHGKQMTNLAYIASATMT